MAQWKITVNGQEQQVEAPADMPLLWVLRDKLQLIGSKFGCGTGVCGICTVHADGKAIHSCTTPISEVAGQNILTIEGLDPEGHHPLQRAWVEEEVPQCGYCQPGQIMAAAALLQQSPNPTDAEIDDSMSRVLCRCGTYQRIRRAIHRAAQLQKEEKGHG